MIKLYNYFRSSASFRVRIALAWKDIAYEYIPIHLVKDGGQQNQESYRKINPMGHVPTLDHNGFLLTETMAILQYLDDRFPQKRLFPENPRARAEVIQLCEIINSGIQPLQNLKLQRYVESEFKLDKERSNAFIRHWIVDGFHNLEKFLQKTSGLHAYKDTITAADCFMVPQVLTAKRFEVDLKDYPNIVRVNESAALLAAFQKASPENQPDYEKPKA